MGKYMTRIQGSQESSNCEGTGQFQEFLKTVPENIKIRLDTITERDIIGKSKHYYFHNKLYKRNLWKAVPRNEPAAENIDRHL